MKRDIDTQREQCSVLINSDNLFCRVSKIIK